MMKKEKKREKAVKITEKSNVEFDKLQVMTSGRVYQTLLTKKYKSRTQWAKPNPQQIKSIIPGTVTEITVKTGDSVKKGDRIMVYEAMKMQNIILAPFNGVVESIFVEEGVKLPKGYLMIYLKADEAFEDATSENGDNDDEAISNVRDLVG